VTKEDLEREIYQIQKLIFYTLDSYIYCEATKQRMIKEYEKQLEMLQNLEKKLELRQTKLETL
jgi:hypothetical protein